MPQSRAFDQKDADNPLMRFAQAAAKLECSVHEFAILETPPTSDDDENANNDPIYDRFFTNQRDPADCLKKSQIFLKISSALELIY